MKLKKRLLRKSHLYLIADKKAAGARPVVEIVKKIKNSGIDIIQLRDKESPKESVLKDAYAVRKLLSGSQTLFIINDYLDIAKIADADGVHLGQEDTPVEIARKLLGIDKVIGVSCHNLAQALNAQKKGADYISIGPFFPTPTKPEYKAIGPDLIRRAKKMVRIPFFAIGGIDETNVSKVFSSGAKRVAFCRAICRAKNISLAAKKISKITGQLQTRDREN